ncbi:MAG: hypothetical protein ACLSH8_00825 [Zhenhengia sp.]|uniref:hypothetical protein n=1 Tax=Zhenhengia sp. TaxID=2944208 RepID=UPI00290EBE6E|nr:hypothetical protein [Clostridiales bacterium]MDU6973234.1 hypothetical protein [Clostridiales bacterium]
MNKMTTNMDAYTILYQAKAQMCKSSYKAQEGNVLKEEEIRHMALAVLEEGIKQIRYEYPPNVSKRMQKYYHQNKAFLIDRFSDDVKNLLAL